MSEAAARGKRSGTFQAETEKHATQYAEKDKKKNEIHTEKRPLRRRTPHRSKGAAKLLQSTGLLTEMGRLFLFSFMNIRKKKSNLANRVQGISNYYKERSRRRQNNNNNTNA